MKILRFYEDINIKYLSYILDTLYPTNIDNKYIVYISSFLHMIGTMFISLGIFFPKDYQPFYLIYLILIALSYLFFEGRCFATLFANKYSGKKNSPLHIRMVTAKTLLGIHILWVIIGLFDYKYSVRSLMKYIFCD